MLLTFTPGKKTIDRINKLLLLREKGISVTSAAKTIGIHRVYAQGLLRWVRENNYAPETRK